MKGSIYYEIFNKASFGILLIDSDTDRIINMNPYLCDLMGYSRDKLMGRKYWQIDHLKRISDYYKEVKAKGIGYTGYIDTRFITRDGRDIFTGLRFNKHRFNNKNIIQLTYHNVTLHRYLENQIRRINAELEKRVKERTLELTTAYKELQKLDKLKSDFVSTVSHELRTPLTIIKEGVCIILGGLPGPINEQQKKMLNVAKKNIDRLAGIINSLLDISKLEAGRVELKKGLINIVAIIKETAKSFRNKLKEKGLGLKLDIPKKEISVYCDGDKIVEVFTNLLGNAIKFTENGFIECSIDDKGEKVECVIKDTGIGIAKKNLPHLFDKFRQFGRIEGPGYRGTGLGLSITKGIIELHGGKISAESQLGKGTKIMFTLPKTPLAPPSLPGDAPYESKKENIISR